MIDEKKVRQFGLSMESMAVHGYKGHDPLTGAVSFPIYQTTTYVNPGLGLPIDYSYTRCSNPTREELENTIALLENGKYGFAFSTGLAAVQAVLSLLSAGDHIVMSDDIYGGTYRLLEEIFCRFGIQFTYVDIGDTEAVERAVRKQTKMIFAETPTNPMMKVADIAAIAGIAKAHGAIFAVDNTFLTPYFQKPLTLGADIVIHSATKFLAGHHDTMAGLVVVKDASLTERLGLILRTVGSGLSPFDAWLTLRGIKTLGLRMQKHEQNAILVADWLKHNKNVEKVYFVGLKEHPSYAVTARQTTGFGGMISFSLKDVTLVEKALCGYDMILFAESLGGVETLITYPMTQTHASIPQDIRNRIGITERLLRLSVGIESADDIIRDLAKVLGEN